MSRPGLVPCSDARGRFPATNAMHVQTRREVEPAEPALALGG
jgi:hypothetical protein